MPIQIPELSRRHFLAAVAAAAPAWSAGGILAAEPAKGFTDDWQRPDGPLGNGWKSAHDDHPTWWDPMVLNKGKPVNPKPDQGKVGQPNNSGARCAAYQDFGPKFADNFSIGVTWCGRRDAVGCTVASINLDDPDWGLAFCYEPQLYTGAFVLWALGRAPNNIRVIASGAPKGKRHVDGTKMFLEMQVRGDKVTCLADGIEILTSPIPKPLIGRTTHGVLVDVNPVPGRPANEEVLNGPFVLKPLEG